MVSIDPDDVVGEAEQGRIEGGQRGPVAGRQVVPPHPFGIPGGEQRVVLGPVVVGVDLVDLAGGGPVARLGPGHVAEPLPAQVLVAERPHHRLGLVGRVPEELALLPGGRVDELLLGGVEAGVGAHVPDRIEHRLGRREGGRGHVGHGGVPGDEGDLVAVDRLAGIVDLQVAEPEVTVGLERLGPRALGVARRTDRCPGCCGWWRRLRQGRGCSPTCRGTVGRPRRGGRTRSASRRRPCRSRPPPNRWAGSGGTPGSTGCSLIRVRWA